MKTLQMNYGPGEFLRYALPSTVSMLVFSLYTMVDGMFVAHGVGEDALAAVNLSMPFTNCIFALAVLLAVGTSTVTAIHIGRGELESGRRIATLNTVVVAVIALLITVLTQLFLEPIALLLGATDSTLSYVMDYLGIVSRFALCYMVSYCLEVLIKVDGYPQLSTVGVLACCCTNILLDYVFVIRWGWGVAGAAWATGIAQTISFLLFLTHFLSKRANIKPLFKKPDFSPYRRILPLGFADFSAEISLGLIVLLFNRVILAVIGEQGVVSFAVVSYVNTLMLMLATGITQGMQPLVSIYHGMKERRRCAGYYRMGLISVCALGILMFAVCQLFAPFITSLLLEEDSHVFEYTAYALRRFSFAFLICGINICTAGFFTATERPARSMTISLLRGFVLVAVAMLTLVSILGGEGVWFTTGLSELMCLAVTAALILRWRRESTGLAEK